VTTWNLAALDTPIGALSIALDDARVRAIAFREHWPRLRSAVERRVGSLELRDARGAPDAVRRLRDYFAGDVAALDALDVAPDGTAFQRRVWAALRRIPHGDTRTYAALARAVRAPGAARAVGAACGANPVWIAVPCHRALGADGSLTGYAGGVERKRWLLEHEAKATRR
jgi:methylated-DNA-[protein]-cysteine S-methyltransferase